MLHFIPFVLHEFLSSNATLSVRHITVISTGLLLVQSLNSPFFPPHIGAEPGRAKRESKITCMRMLKTNQSKITRPLSIRVHTCSHQSVAQYLFQLARWKKKHFLWCWYCGKKTNWYVFYRGLYSYRQRLRVITLSQTFFRIVSAFWVSLQKVLKGKSDAYK